MDTEKKISETKLLYDPMFAKKPDVDMRGRQYLGFKIGFVIMISIFVAISLYFSFTSLSSDMYVYKENDTGYTLSQFNGTANDTSVFIDSVRDENGEAIDGTVTKIREFSMSCNEYVRFIFIGKDVAEIEDHCFYYTKNLLAIIVDKDNPYYTSVDGVLYNKDMSEIIIHPMQNHEYRAGLAKGLSEPSDANSADEFTAGLEKLFGEKVDGKEDEYNAQFSDYLTYDIPDSVVKITDSCFSDCEYLKFVNIPDSVKEIGSLAFFKCKGFEKIYIPDSVESIGSDGFSYCENVDYIFVPASVKSIGHHCFYGCMGIQEIYMGAETEDDFEAGENWLPRKSTKSMKNIDVIYGQTRRGE